MTQAQASQTTSCSDKLKALIDNMNKTLIGQSNTVDLAVTAFLAGGHVLLEDVPGVGKTLLAKTLSHSVKAIFKRVQCTPDLLPSDISGVSIYNQKEGTFTFNEGPIFTNILLADEINRATPRTQSSLLEAMEENQVTIDGETRALPELFFVIATQNPIEYHGTFPLPEAQLDRFMIALSLGYPKPEEEVMMLEKTLVDGSFDVASVLSVEEVVQLKEAARKVFIDGSIHRYIVDITNATRNSSLILLGVSPRGSQLMLRAAQSHALIKGRDYVTPEDVKILAPYVLGHRIIPQQRGNRVTHSEFIHAILEKVKVPV